MGHSNLDGAPISDVIGPRHTQHRSPRDEAEMPSHVLWRNHHCYRLMHLDDLDPVSLLESHVRETT